jgi:uncharacterized protein YggE
MKGRGGIIAAAGRENMKYGISLLIIVVMAFSSSVTAGEAPDVATIEVMGKASIMVAPNLAKISFSVEAYGQQAQEAVRENARRADTLLSTLKSIAGTDAKLRTSGLSVSPVYEKGDRLRPQGYRALNTVVFETKQLEDLGMFIDKAAEAGANRFGGLIFRNDQDETFKSQAAVKALKRAMKDAEDLASAAGLTIRRTVKIVYGPREIPPIRHYAVMAEARGPATPLEIGEIPIEATVSVIVEVH